MASDKRSYGPLVGILPTSLPFPEIPCVRAHEKLSVSVTHACATQHFSNTPPKTKHEKPLDSFLIVLDSLALLNSEHHMSMKAS